MKREHIFLIFILFLTFLSIYLLYQILSPFLSSIVWAILLAMVFYPLFKKLQRLLRKKEILILRSILARVGKHVNLDPLPLLLKNLNQISTFIFNQTTILLKGFSTF